MVSKKGFSAADVSNASMIIMVVVMVFTAIYWYMTLHGRTELFTTVSRIYEYSYYSTSAKMFLKNAAKYSYTQASQEGGATEERFKIIFGEYLAAFTKKDPRITNSPKVESVSFESKDIIVKLDKPIMFGEKDSYALIDSKIYCKDCIG